MTPRPLALQRCFNHTLREAVALCSHCGHFYCRECITEHEDRVICATCLQRAATVAQARPSHFLRWLAPVIPCLLGFLLLWLFFYVCGAVLLKIPHRFHEGTVWVDHLFGP